MQDPGPAIESHSIEKCVRRINWLAAQGMRRPAIEADLKDRLSRIDASRIPSRGHLEKAIISAAFRRAGPLNDRHAAALRQAEERAAGARKAPAMRGATRAEQHLAWLSRMQSHGRMPVDRRGFPGFSDGPDKLVRDGLATLTRSGGGYGNARHNFLEITDKGRAQLARLEARAARRNRKHEPENEPGF